MAIACKLCIKEKGLKDSEISRLPQTEEEFLEHLREVHGIEITVRKGDGDEHG